MSFLTKNIKIIAFTAFAVIIICAAAFNYPQKPYIETFFAFDTTVRLEIYGENAQKAAASVKESIYNLDNIVNAYNESSFTSKYNCAQSGEAVEIPSELMELVEKSIELSEMAEGYFDITVFPLVKLWNVKNAKEPPENEEIEKLLPFIGNEQLEIRDGALIKKQGTEIDFGGAAKGFAADKIREIFKEYDIKQAVVNIGGNVCTVGGKNKKSGWSIGVANPFSPNDIYLSVEVKNANVITSGAYQRYFEYKGQRYHHILSPFDGKPAQTDIASVTIISENGIMADAFSTAVFAAGAEKGIHLLEKYGLNAVIIKENGEIKTVGNVNILKTFY